MFQWWLNFLLLPDEDTLLSHRLDVASDELTCLQCVYQQNFRVLRWFGLLWVQPGRAKLRSNTCYLTLAQSHKKHMEIVLPWDRMRFRNELSYISVSFGGHSHEICKVCI